METANSSPRTGYFITFLDGFLDYIQEKHSPLDFFSWHSYSGIKENITYAKYARERLNAAGFTSTETSCNEWNFASSLRGSMFHAAHNTAILIAFQHSPLDNAMFYDARIGLSIYGGLFNPLTRKPFPLYYGFQAFGQLYRLGSEMYSHCELPDVYVAAAADNGSGGILIVNTAQEQPLHLDITGGQIISCQTVEEVNGLVECPLPDTLPENSIFYLSIRKTE